MPRIPDTLAHLAVDVADLMPYAGNARRGNLSALKESLRTNGQYRPIVVRSGTNEVLAGNHTLAAAKSLGWSQIAATFVDVDDEQARRIVLVDNRTNDLAGYDDDALRELLRGLDSYEGTGFSDVDVNALLAVDDEPLQLTEPDAVPPLAETPTICQPGDVFDLGGGSALMVGDSTDTLAVLEVLGDRRAYTVWTDPPYGVSYVGKTDDALTIQNDGAGDLPELLAGAMRTAAACSRPGAAVYVAHADTARAEFEGAMRAAGMLVRQCLVWVKNTMVLGHSDYQWKHEPILKGEIASEDEEPLTYEPVLYGFAPTSGGRLGRGGGHWFGDNRRTTVFEVPKPPRNAEHPTMKPVALVRAMIENSTPQGGLVLDLFGGSGSTLIAAYDARMSAVLVELDPRYADVICRRWQQHTGLVPVRRADGAKVSFVEDAA